MTIREDDFQQGSWTKLPSNCTTDFLLTQTRCAEYGMVAFWKCAAWVKDVVLANGGTAFLLTDGSVMMQELSSIFGASWGTRRWWKLTPDEFGNYANGIWTRLADSTVGRKYFASAVLSDGRVLVCGGEYSDASGAVQQDETNTCEVYDPVLNSWTNVPPPHDLGSPPVPWDEVGDSPSTLLSNGRFLIGANNKSSVAMLDISTLSWTALRSRLTVPSSAEESWVLMPDGTVVGPSCTVPPTTWMYDPTKDRWNQGNDLPTSIVNSPVDTVPEIGPGLLRYDGSAFFLGGNSHTAVFNPRLSSAAKWSNGPDLPSLNGRDLGIVDGPAALLVNGNVLFGAAPTDAAGSFLSPCWYFEFDGVTFQRTTDPPNNSGPTYLTRLLLLPTGDVLFCREDDSSFYAYHPAAEPLSDARPVIQQFPIGISPGATIDVSGLRFNGLSQAVAYGDDSQTATNYPLVRMTHNETGTITYCRTFNHRKADAGGNSVPSMGVATGNAVITTSAAVPASIGLGSYSLVVVANGIESAPVQVTVSVIG